MPDQRLDSALPIGECPDLGRPVEDLEVVLQRVGVVESRLDSLLDEECRLPKVVAALPEVVGPLGELPVVGGEPVVILRGHRGGVSPGARFEFVESVGRLLRVGLVTQRSNCPSSSIARSVEYTHTSVGSRRSLSRQAS